MGVKVRMEKSHRVLIWVVALSISLAAFYLMDQFVMSMQGLPLGWDLSPAQ